MKWMLPLLLFGLSQNANPLKTEDNTVTYSNSSMLAVYHGPHIMIGGGQIMEVKNEDDKVMIHIDNDGKVTYGDNYKPDETAKVFWTTLAQSYPGVCEKIEAEKKQ